MTGTTVVQASSSNDGQHLLSLDRRRQILIAVLGDQDVILDANATHWHVPFQNFQVDEFAVSGIGKVYVVEYEFVEIDAGFNCDDIAGFEGKRVVRECPA